MSLSLEVVHAAFEDIHILLTRDERLLPALLIGLLTLALTYIWFTRPEKPVRFHYPAPPQASPSWSNRRLSSPSITAHLSDSSLLPAGADNTKEYITCYDPATAQHIDTVRALSAEEIREKVKKAREAQRGWAGSSWERRRRVMRGLLDWTVREMDGLVRVACRDTGKTKIDASFGEILTTAEKLRWLIVEGEKVLSPSPRATNLLLSHKVSKVVYEPLGVAVASVSWNYPAHNALSPIIASLFAGNSIVLKGSELVAWSTAWYVGAVRACLEACGEDPELVQLVICYPDAVEALTTSPDIDHITFIGSEVVGKKVALAAAQHLTPCTIELGGKDPAIILEGANVKFFEATFMRSAFQGGGQNCIGIERFIVHASLYDAFLSRMASRVAALRVGPSLLPDPDAPAADVGAIITDARFDRLEQLVREAVEGGARVLVGGKRMVKEEWEGAHYFSPTLIVDVTPEMRIAQEELFAPIMTVMHATSTEHAIRLANGTRYGLGAAVFGNDREECRRVVRELRCGMVSVNDFGVFYLNQSMPFGGVGSSGYGRFGGPEGLRGLCNPKSVTEDRFFSLIRTPIPAPLDYPIPSARKSWEFVKGLVRVAYARGVWERLGGLGGILRGSV